MITTDPAAVVTRYIYAVRDGDSGAIRDSFAEDAIWEYPGDLPLSGTWRGRDTIVDDFLGSVGTALEPGSTVALEVTSVLTAGDQVVAEWTSPCHRPGRCRVPQPQRRHLHRPRRQDRRGPRVHRHPARRPRPVRPVLTLLVRPRTPARQASRIMGWCAWTSVQRLPSRLSAT